VFVRVTLNGGAPQLLFVHAEVQNEPDRAFARRMFGHTCRLGDQAGEDVLSLAILADGQEAWRPDRFEREMLGSRLVFVFPSVKLLDFRHRREALRGSGAAGLDILAQLDAIECRRRPGELRERKFGLIQALHGAGDTREEVQGICERIDWMITLPDLEESRRRWGGSRGWTSPDCAGWRKKPRGSRTCPNWMFGWRRRKRGVEGLRPRGTVRHGDGRAGAGGMVATIRVRSAKARWRIPGSPAADGEVEGDSSRPPDHFGRQRRANRMRPTLPA
jgi:hypothetical protein